MFTVKAIAKTYTNCPMASIPTPIEIITSMKILREAQNMDGKKLGSLIVFYDTL